MTLYAIIGVVVAALAAVLGIKWRASSQISKAKDGQLAAEKKAATKDVEAVEAKAESKSHAAKVDQANEAVDHIEAARKEQERRAKVLEEAMLNAPKVDPADPRPGAARLRHVPAGSEAVSGVHRDAGEGDRGAVADPVPGGRPTDH